MFLLGTIDRVDVCEEDDRVLMRVIDYKSGAKKFEMEDFYYGLELQLIIYMNAAEEIYHKETKKDVTPAGVFYRPTTCKILLFSITVRICGVLPKKSTAVSRKLWNLTMSICVCLAAISWNIC